MDHKNFGFSDLSDLSPSSSCLWELLFLFCCGSLTCNFLLKIPELKYMNSKIKSLTGSFDITLLIVIDWISGKSYLPIFNITFWLKLFEDCDCALSNLLFTSFGKHVLGNLLYSVSLAFSQAINTSSLIVFLSSWNDCSYFLSCLSVCIFQLALQLILCVWKLYSIH